MRVGIISVFTDYHRKGRHYRIGMQPQAGPLIAGLLPRDIEIEVINDAWGEPDWDRDYDLLFLSGLFPLGCILDVPTWPPEALGIACLWTTQRCTGPR